MRGGRAGWLRLGLLIAGCGLVLSVAGVAEAQTAGDGAASDALRGIGEGPSFGESVRRSLVALAVVLGLVGLSAWLLPRLLRKRFEAKAGRAVGATGEEGGLRVESSVVLERGRRVYVLRVGDRRFLMGASERGLGPVIEAGAAPGGADEAKEGAGTGGEGSGPVSFEAALRERPPAAG
ncbi:MAG: flagellar biosynthetic protein FliO [Planctomycetota bacterium]